MMVRMGAALTTAGGNSGGRRLKSLDFLCSELYEQVQSLHVGCLCCSLVTITRLGYMYAIIPQSFNHEKGVRSL